MAIEKMKLMKITGELNSLDKFIALCCENGDFHPEPAMQILSGSMGFAALNEENPYAPMLQKLQEFMGYAPQDMKFSGKPETKFAPCDDETIEYVRSVSKSFLELYERRKTLQKQKDDCETGIAQFSHFVDLNVDVDKLFECEFVKVRFGHMPKDSYTRMSAHKENDYTVFIPCSTDTTDYWGVYCAPREHIEEVDLMFASLHFERLRVPDGVGTPQEVIDGIKDDIERFDKEIEVLDKEINECWSKNGEKIYETYEQISGLNTLFELRRYAAYRGNYFFYAGWVPVGAVQSFEKAISAVDGLICETDEPESEENLTPPVKLKNPKIFRPFEYFVNMYGMPSYSDIDVTAFVAITYTLLFGIMFADLGQGLVLAIGGALLWKLKKNELARIIVPCGISSCVFGFVFGSVFGYEEALDPVYHALGWAGKPISVMDSVTTVLLFAIGIGVTLVIVAMVLNMYACIKRKHFGEAIFGQNGLVGILLYISGVLFVISFMTRKQVLPNNIVFTVMGITALLLYVREIPIGLIDHPDNWKPESWGEFFMQNFFELFEFILSYFSNTVSFLRVGAFVIVHASMMMVVFTLGGGGKNIPVIILGNIVVIALEGLLTGIQGLRLEFYEMFSRFYDGGGRPFESVRAKLAERKSK